jgi:ADP-ribose pyrophosphatase YjhB (NUDIX family)
VSATFCPECGGRLEQREKSGRVRQTCPECGYVEYRNPAVGVAVVLRDESGRVLLGRRATGDYAGLWCIPCGYVEWDEEVREAAVREFEEETGVRVTLGDVVAVHSNFHNREKQTVGIWFEGKVVGGRLHPVDGEFTELGWFAPGEPPELAFPTDGVVLRDLTPRRPHQRWWRGGVAGERDS